MTDQDAGTDPDQGIDERSLMKIAYSLPRYDAVEEIEALAMYGDMLTALQAYLAAYQRDPLPRLGTMRASLARLDEALTEIAAAWAAADHRTKHHLYEAMGEQPFVDSELRPVNERVGTDSWTRGVYRIMNFNEGASRLAASVATVKREAAAADQDRPGPHFPGLDELIERLAEIFTERTGRPFSDSRNRDSATDFVGEVIATLPEQCRPTSGSLSWAIKRTVTKRLTRARE